LIILGSEAPSLHRGRSARDALAYDKEENTCSEDEFVDIDDLDGDNSNSKIAILVVGGGFSSTIGRIKSKRAKGKESWVFTKGSYIIRNGELHWKCNLAPCKLYSLYLYKDILI
jgi:hypothetical protein